MSRLYMYMYSLAYKRRYKSQRSLPLLCIRKHAPKDRSRLFISLDKELPLLPQNHAAAQSPQLDSLRTTWRLHPLGDTTVWEADCFFLEASVGQFLRWERSLDSPDEADNPFAPFDR